MGKDEKPFGGYEVTIDMAKKFSEAKKGLDEIQLKVDTLELKKQNLTAQVDALKAQIADLSKNQDKLLERMNEQIVIATTKKHEEFHKLQEEMDRQQRIVDKKINDNERKGRELDSALAGAINTKKNYESSKRQSDIKQAEAERMVSKFKKVIEFIETSLKG